MPRLLLRGRDTPYAPQLMGVATPLRLEAWARALAAHPDQAFARYILDGLREGFRIGFQWDAPPSVGILEHSVCPATPRDNYGLPPEGMLSEWNARAVSQHPRPDEVASLVSELGKGALLAKVDIHAAYRLIPVHPQDRLLLAMRWEGQIYIDPMLPFGLRSAPKVFNAVADALNWHLHQMGIPLVCNYLDDFLSS